MNDNIVEMEQTSWTDSRTFQFIDLLRIHECYWHIDSNDYSDRVNRQKALPVSASELRITELITIYS